MMTTISASVQKGLKMYTESELLWWWALWTHRARCLHLPNHKRQNWRKKNSIMERGRESKAACPNQVPMWTMSFFKDNKILFMTKVLLRTKTACRKVVLFRKKVIWKVKKNPQNMANYHQITFFCFWTCVVLLILLKYCSPLSDSFC